MLRGEFYELACDQDEDTVLDFFFLDNDLPFTFYTSGGFRNIRTGDPRSLPAKIPATCMCVPCMRVCLCLRTRACARRLLASVRYRGVCVCVCADVCFDVSD